MVGREAYHHPWAMASWDTRFLDVTAPAATDRAEVELAMVAYMEREAAAHGTPWTHIARHMLGLWNGAPGARRWRQVWSDHHRQADTPRVVGSSAHEAMTRAVSG
jgi:tRNA-dihydrouridine synthase A